MPVRCYGRRYEAQNQQELDELLALLVRRDLRLANRYRVGGSWPRGKRAQLQRQRLYMSEPIVRPPEPDGAVDLDECPNLSRCRCGGCRRCGAPKHCAYHGSMYGEPPGSAPWGHRFEPLNERDTERTELTRSVAAVRGSGDNPS